jgi:hypothetical protein
LEQQLPALVAAEPTNLISKADITEMKSLNRPPAGVKLTMEVICILLQVAPVRLDYWEPSKKLLSDINFLGKILELRVDNVPTSTLDAVAPYMARDDFTPEIICKHSRACAGLCKWAREVYKYHLVSAQVTKQRAASRHATGAGDKAVPALPAEAAEAPEAASLSDLKSLNNPAQNVVIERAKADTDSCFHQASPALEMAAKALEVLDKKDIAEIKSMAAPPQPVMVVCMCVCILRPLGKEDENGGWAAAKAMLSDVTLLRALQEYKKDDMQAKQIDKIRKLLSREKETFEGETMKSVSRAGYGLLQWVLAMVKYFDVAKAIEPKRKLLNELQTNVPQVDAKMTSTFVVTVKDVQELKCLAKPPAAIPGVLKAVGFLLGSEESLNWKQCQQMMASPDQFVKKLEAFDVTQTTASALSQASDIAMQPFFNVGELKKVSVPVARLGEWVLDVVGLAQKSPTSGGA